MIPRSPVRHWRLAGISVCAIAAASLFGAPGGAPMARAVAVSPSPSGGIDVVKVQGVLDPALFDYVQGTVQAAERDRSTVILQIDSRGSYGQIAPRLADRIRRSTVLVVAWIGPSGARAEGGALLLVYAASLVAMSPGAGIGPARPFDLSTSITREAPGEVAAESAALLALAPGAGARVEGVRRLISGPSLPAGPAIDAGAVSVAAFALPDLLKKLDGRTVLTRRGPVTLHTVNGPGQQIGFRFHEIGPVRRVLHGVSTPAAVYVLLILGLWAVAFEMTQPGFGVAGIAGMGALALAGYGLSVIPVHWLGIGLILGGIGLQGLDVVIRRLAAATLAGTGLFAAGSILAWRGVAPAIDLSLWLVVLATVAGALFFGFGMTVALRSRERVRSAQVGLVGLVGEVRTDLDPEGGVYVKGSMWRARSMDGPIPKGTRVRVKGVDGLILRVEQEPGGPD